MCIIFWFPSKSSLCVYTSSTVFIRVILSSGTSLKQRNLKLLLKPDISFLPLWCSLSYPQSHADELLHVGAQDVHLPLVLLRLEENCHHLAQPITQKADTEHVALTVRNCWWRVAGNTELLLSALLPPVWELLSRVTAAQSGAHHCCLP